LLRALRITVLTDLHRSSEAIEVAKRSVEQWETEFDSNEIHDVLSLRLAAIEAAKLNEWRVAVELFDRAYSFSSRKLGHGALSLGLQADEAFACWKSDQAAECIKRFSLVLAEVETFSSEELNKSHGFRLRKFIGGCLIWIQHQLEGSSDSVSEPPPGVCSKQEAAKGLCDLPNTHPDMLWYMLTQIDYYLGTNISVELIEQRLLDASYPPVRVMFRYQKIQRALSSGSLDSLPELLANFVDIGHKVHSELSVQNPRMGPPPSINLSNGLLSNDRTVGLPLFCVALLRIAESNSTVQNAFSNWRGFCATDSRFTGLIRWMELAERQLTLDPATSLLVANSTADFWSERVPAAVNVVFQKDASPNQVVIGQYAVMQFLLSVPWIHDVASAVANRFANYWQNQLRYRAQFHMPFLTTPDLEKACNRPNKDGLAKISDIINTSARALNQSLAAGVREFLDRLSASAANRQ
jgi:hypothetical protein